MKFLMKAMKIGIDKGFKFKHLTFIMLTLFILTTILMGSRVVGIAAYSYRQQIESADYPDSNRLINDPVTELLGKSFDEIKQLLGEPSEHGYSDWPGPSSYILYQHGEEFIQLFSPEPVENKIAVSIILGPGHGVLGAKVGMSFPEIANILGKPDYGPAIGMNNLYSMEYFRGEIKDQMPEVFISFVALSMNSPTDHVFIKWESFEYDETKNTQATR